MEEFKDEQVDETLHGICTYIDNYMYFNKRSETNSGNDICKILRSQQRLYAGRRLR